MQKQKIIPFLYKKCGIGKVLALESDNLRFKPQLHQLLA